MGIETSRREFLAGSAGALMTVAAFGENAPPPAIVDTHVHLWDLKKFRLPWLQGAPSLDRSFLWEDYQRASEGLNVEKAVYMEVDVEPSQQEQEARTLIELCERGKTRIVAAIISGRPASENFRTYIEPMARQKPIKGLRQVLHGPGTPAGYCLSAEFIRGIRLLGDLGLSFDLCMRPDELRDGARLIKECPGTSFILDHCGNAEVFAKDPSSWKQQIAEVAERPNVACKVSGIVASTRGKPWTPEDLAPIVRHVLEVFGPDRVVFGGDWPVCTLGAPLAEWVNALRTIVSNRSQEEQRKLFHDNAMRVYRLS
jgi:L-fuconolactonase